MHRRADEDVQHPDDRKVPWLQTETARRGYDGGYQEYTIAPLEALARIPDSLDPARAAPLMCAGIITFNALRHSGAMPGELVAVQGVGGLGHLGIQFAKKSGYRVAAVGRGTQNAATAKNLGADIYIDSAATDAAAEVQKLGGAHVLLATAPSGKAMSSLVAGLGAYGTFVVVGASADPIEIPPALSMFGKRASRAGLPGHLRILKIHCASLKRPACPMIKKGPWKGRRRML